MNALPEAADLRLTPRWLHVAAMLTACTAVPLLLLGAEVTTKQVGMVDPVGFREPWHLLRILDRAFRELGLLIEHSHRLFGFLVGTCAIVLAVGLWLREPKRWLRWLGVAGMLGVGIQGILGGFRVNLISRDLAMLHGCFAQLVFALLICLAVFTAPSWNHWERSIEDGPAALRLWHWSILTVVLIYLQIVLGALVRHKDVFLGARLHLLVAFAVVAAIVWLLKLAQDAAGSGGRLPRAALLLGILVIVQLMLGVESWMSRFGSAQWHQLHPLFLHPDLARSFHYLVGSFVFATSVIVAVQAYLQAAWVSKAAPAPAQHVKGAV